MTKKHVTILGAGTAGVMLANKLCKEKNLSVTVIDPATDHYYQPAFLFFPFGKYKLEQLRKPSASLLKKSVRHLQQAAAKIDAEHKKITLADGTSETYDALVIATGTRVDASLTDGLMGEGWRKSVHDFYTPDGASALRDALQNFQSGRLVMQIMEMPIKCPVAPLEFCFLADEYFRRRGIRKNVEIVFSTPLSGAFTKPVASEKLGNLLSQKGITLSTDFYVEKVDEAANTLHCFDSRTLTYDLLVTVPIDVGASIVSDSGLGDDMGFVEVDPHTLQSKKYSDVFAIGDATNVATSKAGSVAHFEAEILEQNIKDFLAGKELSASFDGHSNCFVEMGDGKALLLDFNYEVQPLEGTFPFPVFGPMKLLKPSRVNHFGKLAFRYIYWYMLLPGRKIPFIHSHMSLKGKKLVKN